ncbi:unnamed protein product, partial [Allacma fusca]
MDTQDAGFSEFGNLAAISGDPFHDENFTLISEPPLGNVHNTSNNTGGNQVQEQDNVEINQNQDESFYETEETSENNFFSQVREFGNQVELDSFERGIDHPSLGEASVALQGRRSASRRTPNGRITKKRRSRILTPGKKEAERRRSHENREKKKDYTKKLEEDLENARLEYANLKKETDAILATAAADKEISELIQNWQRDENQNFQAEIRRLQ